MDQREINDAEWRNRENWAGPVRWLEIYFSKRDSRLWVPKSIPLMGWTINFGHRWGIIWMLGLFMLIYFVLLGVCIGMAGA